MFSCYILAHVSALYIDVAMQSYLYLSSIKSMFDKHVKKKYIEKMFHLKLYLYVCAAYLILDENFFQSNDFQSILLMLLFFVDLVVSYEDMLDLNDFNVHYQIDALDDLSDDYKWELSSFLYDIDSSSSSFLYYFSCPESLYGRLEQLHSIFYDDDDDDPVRFLHK